MKMPSLKTKKLNEYIQVISRDFIAALSFFKLDNIKIALTIIFSVLYLPHAFILVEDIGLLSAYEVDPGSILASLEDMLRNYNYNMHTGFHSKYYGWTYFSINFILFAPIKIFCDIFAIDHSFYLYLTARLILFSIGLVSLIAFYEVLRRLFNSKTLAILGSLLYIFNEVSFNLFYFIHPETTGMAFIFLAILCLMNLMEEPTKYKNYIYGLVFLILASLSKQIFFFISLPILSLSIYHLYLGRKQSIKQLTFRDFVRSREFLKIVKHTVFLSILILFIIHPFSIIEIKNAINFQIETKKFFANSLGVLTLSESFKQWKALFSSYNVVVFFFLTAPMCILFNIYSQFKYKKSGNLLSLFNSVSLIILSILIISGNRRLISGHYIFPLYPFFIIHLISTIHFLLNVEKNKYSRFPRLALIVFLTYFSVILAIKSIYLVVPKNYERFNYKNSATYLTYNYIKDNLGPNDKIAYDHLVAFPKKSKATGCHYWQGCGTDYIDKFKPNYIMFWEEFYNNGKMHEPTKRLHRYIKENKMHLVKKLSVDDKGIKISVYKK